jgi:hypothetical protein
MIRYLAIILIAFGTNVAYAQSTENRSIGSFSGVKAYQGLDVYLKKGDKESIRVEASKGNASDVVTEISGAYLKIHMRDGKHKTAATVYVTYVKIDKISVSAAANIYSDGQINAPSLEINAASAGSVDVSIETDKLTANASAAGDMELKGKAKTVSVLAESAGEVDAFDLEAENVNAKAESGGSVKVSVTKDLVARAESGGGIRYRGNPDKQITNSTSGGSVKKSN